MEATLQQVLTTLAEMQHGLARMATLIPGYGGNGNDQTPTPTRRGFNSYSRPGPTWSQIAQTIPTPNTNQVIPSLMDMHFPPLSIINFGKTLPRPTIQSTNHRPPHHTNLNQPTRTRQTTRQQLGRTATPRTPNTLPTRLEVLGTQLRDLSAQLHHRQQWPTLPKYLETGIDNVLGSINIPHPGSSQEKIREIGQQSKHSIVDIVNTQLISNINTLTTSIQLRTVDEINATALYDYLMDYITNKLGRKYSQQYKTRLVLLTH